MVLALTQYQAQMDADLNAAVESFCQPDNIARIIQEAAKQALNEAIEQEVRAFFARSGEGRKAVAAAVKEALLKRETFTVLDET